MDCAETMGYVNALTAGARALTKQSLLRMTAQLESVHMVLRGVISLIRTAPLTVRLSALLEVVAIGKQASVLVQLALRAPRANGKLTAK